MDDSFHYILMANQAMVHQRLLASLAETELSIGQPKILDFLLDSDGSSQKDIAAACHIKPSSLTVLLGRMEEQGMIERRMLNGNRRSLYVYLTDYGRELAKMVQRSFAEVEETAFDGVPQEEIESFMAVFEKIKKNLKE